MLQVQPGLPCRLHRPWLTVNMDRQQALESLNWHYQTMSRHMPASLLSGYLSKKGFTLLTLTGKDEEQFTVRLCADAFLDKEGEATLASPCASLRENQRCSLAACRAQKPTFPMS